MNCDAIDAKPRDFDWAEMPMADYSDDGEGWSIVYPDPDYVAKGDVETGLECDGCSFVNGEDEETREFFSEGQGDFCEECGDEWAEAQRESDPDWCAPMMNYAYPVPGLSPDGEEAAKLLGSNLTLLEVNGDAYLALTGGGMDFTWEICAAYVALGYRPPVHFARSLPRMAGRGESKSDRNLIEICRESCRIMQRWSDPDSVWRD